ncbi:MAG: phosphotransferase enzyme family protein [Planctomycetaceae bacterium]
MPLNANSRAVLANFAGEFLSQETVAREVLTGFSGAAIVRLDTTCGRFALRGWPPGQVQHERLHGLHRLLQHVFDRGVLQLAVPLRSRDGSTLIEQDGRFWQLEPWMPGCADYHANPNSERLRNAVRCLARWHDAAKTFHATNDEAPWFQPRPAHTSLAVQDRLERLLNWDDARLRALEQQIQHDNDRGFRDRSWRIVRQFRRCSVQTQCDLTIASTFQFDLIPCLRDCWHDHFLFIGDELTGLIDPSACRIDSVAVDLARLIGSFVGDDRTMRAVALDEYARHRPLGSDEIGLVEVLDSSGVLLSAMRWVERRYLNREVFSEPRRVLEMLGELLARLECRPE